MTQADENHKIQYFRGLKIERKKSDLQTERGSVPGIRECGKRRYSMRINQARRKTDWRIFEKTFLKKISTFS